MLITTRMLVLDEIRRSEDLARMITAGGGSTDQFEVRERQKRAAALWAHVTTLRTGVLPYYDGVFRGKRPEYVSVAKEATVESLVKTTAPGIKTVAQMIADEKN